MFDDGDEVVIEQNGLPVEILLPLHLVPFGPAASSYWSVSSDSGQTWTQPRRLLRRD